MAKRRALTKAKIIRDLNIRQSVEIGIMFMIVGVAGVGVILWQFDEMISRLRMLMATVGLFSLVFVALGIFMLFVALKDLRSIKTGNFNIFQDAVKKVEPESGTVNKRVYFEEYTKLRGFWAVNINVDKVNVGDKYFLVKLSSSNFVALAYPCAIFNIGNDIKESVTTADTVFA
jgi:hypothetical protein